MSELENLENAESESHLSRLKELLEQTDFLPQTPSTDEAALEDYLKRTGAVQIPESHRLIAFVEFLSSKLTWKQICEVFEFILRKEQPDERNGTYAVWISKSENLLSHSNFSEEERSQIAHDLIAIFDRALADTPQNAGLALGLGTNYLKEAARRDADTDYISQAVTWLNRAAEWLPAKDKQDQLQKYIYANINLRLAQCYMLLRVYKLALEHLDSAAREHILGGQELQELRAGIDRCTLELGAGP